MMVEKEVDFTEDQCKAIEERAALMGISFDDLIRMAADEMLATPGPDEETEQDSV